VEKLQGSLPDFYVVDEIQGTYRGMMIAIQTERRQFLSIMSLAELGVLPKQLAVQVNLKRFLKQPRDSKTKVPPQVKDPKHPHLSTSRLVSRSPITP
jgi:hypothetical protein